METNHPFQYAISIAKVEDAYELRFAIWTQCMDNNEHQKHMEELMNTVVRTDRQIAGMARFMNQVDDPSLWCSEEMIEKGYDLTASYCDSNLIRLSNVRCNLETMTKCRSDIEMVQCLPILMRHVKERSEKRDLTCCRRLYDMLVNSLIDISSCELEMKSKTSRTFAITIDSCSLILIVLRIVNEKYSIPYLELCFRFMTFASIVQDLVSQSNESQRDRRESISQKSFVNSNAQKHRQVQSEIKEKVCAAHFQSMIYVLYVLRVLFFVS